MLAGATIPGRAAGPRQLHPDDRPLALPARSDRCSARACSRVRSIRRPPARAARAPRGAAIAAGRAATDCARQRSPSARAADASRSPRSASRGPRARGRTFELLVWGVGHVLQLVCVARDGLGLAAAARASVLGRVAGQRAGAAAALRRARSRRGRSRRSSRSRATSRAAPRSGFTHLMQLVRSSRSSRSSSCSACGARRAARGARAASTPRSLARPAPRRRLRERRAHAPRLRARRSDPRLEHDGAGPLPRVGRRRDGRLHDRRPTCCSAPFGLALPRRAAARARPGSRRSTAAACCSSPPASRSPGAHGMGRKIYGAEQAVAHARRERRPRGDGRRRLRRRRGRGRSSSALRWRRGAFAPAVAIDASASARWLRIRGGGRMARPRRDSQASDPATDGQPVAAARPRRRDPVRFLHALGLDRASCSCRRRSCRERQRRNS